MTIFDTTRFDDLARVIGSSTSRRTTLRTAFAALLLAGGVDATEAAKQRRDDIGAEACIPTGKRCPAKKPRGKKKQQLTCKDCCQGIVVRTTNRKGKWVKKCTCRSAGVACNGATAAECCGGAASCQGGVCGGPAGAVTCRGFGAACGADAPCCAGYVCADGSCRTPGSCRILTSACTANEQCCSGFCGDGICRPAGSCLIVTTTCTADTECCSGFCRDDACRATNCQELATQCSDDAQCCSQVCTSICRPA